MMRILACLLLAFAALHDAHAAEAKGSCTGFIDALPATISTPGTWCLAHDLTTNNPTDAAISIDSDDVTLDCNGNRIDGSSAGSGTTAVGIRSNAHDAVTVRRCRVRGFYVGIYLYENGDDANGLIEDNQLDAQRYIGIQMSVSQSLVRRNIVNTVVPSIAGTSPAFGIWTTGTVDVIDNVVANVQGHDSDAIGITTRGNIGGVVRGNRVTGVIRVGAGNVVGIHVVQGSGRVVIRDNTVVSTGQVNSYGLVCDIGTDHAKDNRVFGFANPVFQCADDGNVVH